MPVRRTALFLVMFASSLLAHDMWLEPVHFSGTKGKPAELRLLVGERYAPEAERPLGIDRAYRFQFFDDEKMTDLLEQDELLFPRGSGAVVMERIPASIEMPAEKFNTYLEEEGHFDVIHRRIEAGAYDHPVRERYTRHLKLILAGSQHQDNDYGHIFGLKLELVPRTDPRTVRAGQAFEVLVLFDGKPLTNARLAIYQKDSAEKLARTDSAGKARFTVKRGTILVRTTHLRPCECDDADYESSWAALTFEIQR